MFSKTVHNILEIYRLRQQPSHSISTLMESSSISDESDSSPSESSDSNISPPIAATSTSTSHTEMSTEQFFCQFEIPNSLDFGGSFTLPVTPASYNIHP